MSEETHNCVQYANTENERILEADSLLGRWLMFSAQANHYGHNPDCPTCEFINLIKAYITKWYSLEQFKADHPAIIDEINKNPKKFFMEAELDNDLGGE